MWTGGCGSRHWRVVNTALDMWNDPDRSPDFAMVSQGSDRDMSLAVTPESSGPLDNRGRNGGVKTRMDMTLSILVTTRPDRHRTLFDDQPYV